MNGRQAAGLGERGIDGTVFAPVPALVLVWPDEFLDDAGGFFELFALNLPMVVVMVVMVFAPVSPIFAK